MRQLRGVFVFFVSLLTLRFHYSSAGRRQAARRPGACLRRSPEYFGGICRFVDLSGGSDGHRNRRKGHGARRRKRRHAFRRQQHDSGANRRGRARGPACRSRLRFFHGEKSAGGACGGRHAAAPWRSDHRGADSDLCPKGTADHHSPGEPGFFLSRRFSRAAGGADFSHLPGFGRRAGSAGSGRSGFGQHSGPRKRPGACPRERRLRYFILAGVGTGLAAWGIVGRDSSPMAPSKVRQNRERWTSTAPM